MTFLQPTILWALPLCLAPVLIHMLNRLRFRTVAWGAMMFLLQATRRSTRLARLRQVLVLLCRVLAVAALVCAFGRPLAGGWLGLVLGGPPETIVLLFDRSASMEARLGNGSTTKREQALASLSSALEKLGEMPDLVLIDSVSGQARAVSDAGVLGRLLGPTDTTADLAAMMQAAVDHLATAREGNAEIWIASDLQSSNWRPDSALWPALVERLRAMPNNVTVRVLALDREGPANFAVALSAAQRFRAYGRSQLELALQVAAGRSSSANVPVTLVHEDAARVIGGSGEKTPAAERAAAGPDPDRSGTVAFRHRLSVAPDAEGWGAVEVPGDGNLRDNRSYFVYDREPHLRVVLTAQDPRMLRVLEPAAAPAPALLNHSVQALRPAAVRDAELKHSALVVWQGVFPAEPEVVQALKKFLGTGGVVVFMPPAEGESGTFLDLRWGPVETAPPGERYRIAAWEERSGLLAKTPSGVGLPLDELQVLRRRCIEGDLRQTARYADGRCFLGSLRHGRGRAYFCSSLPRQDWSSLADGTVLVPALQRAARAGGTRLSNAQRAICGRWRPADPVAFVEPVDGEGAKDYRVQAGVYRVAGHLVAVNRDAREDVPDRLEPAELQRLFGPLPFRLFREGLAQTGELQSEMWRPCLGFALACLLLAGLLASADVAGKRQQTAQPARRRRAA